jgi:integrase
MNRLNALVVRNATKPGRLADGDGLYLVVGKTGSKSWVVRVQKDGRRRDIGLGSAKKVPLKLARERAATVRQQIEIGIDPVAERRKRTPVPTFEEAAVLVHGEHQKGWKSGKHQAQWLSTLRSYAFPRFGQVLVSQVETHAVRDALEAIWLSKPETARRLRQRINAIIDWAVAKGYRESGLVLPVIDKSLPKQRTRVKHHAAMPYAHLPLFMTELVNSTSTAKAALQALILTGCRSGEIREARWSELDLEARSWIIPAARMKGGREHFVPLSPAAVRVFEKMLAHRRDKQSFVFPGQKRDKPLSDMTLLKVLRDAGRRETVHGFRSTFRDWVAEQTTYPRELAEVALAHVNSDKTEAAYLRSDRREQRRDMMEEWATFVMNKSRLKYVKI